MAKITARSKKQAEPAPVARSTKPVPPAKRGVERTAHQAIGALKQDNRFMLGVPDMGVRDPGTSTKGNPLPGGASMDKMGRVETFGGQFHAPKVAPEFMGAEPNDIRLAQMVVNHDSAMVGMQRDTGTASKMAAGGGTRMKDQGTLGSTNLPTQTWGGPVKSYVDESIKIKK